MKDKVVSFFDELMGNLGKIREKYNITHTKEERKVISFLKLRKPKFILKKRNPANIFKIMATKGMVPRVDNMDLSIPAHVALAVTEVITQPSLGCSLMMQPYIKTSVNRRETDIISCTSMKWIKDEVSPGSRQLCNAHTIRTYVSWARVLMVTLPLEKMTTRFVGSLYLAIGVGE
ncbi:hypothetical protein OSB04_028143 [Centaurea solstitialis]|uniref:Uncharacterized protein n=1 Tax=Centaurea solstitialis TaxID=347529 RepID=A0AA38W0C2_9ASTR|nr:hypothetical protein OSB04_028143 [Centaurea solstitialis]